MRIGSLVKHKKQGTLGLITRTFLGLEVCYVIWSDDNLRVRIPTPQVEVLSE